MKVLGKPSAFQTEYNVSLFDLILYVLETRHATTNNPSPFHRELLTQINSAAT